MTFVKACALALSLTAPLATPTLAEDTSAALEAMQEYLMFSEYEAGIILPQRMKKADG